MILSSHTTRQLRNASLSALYRVAYDHDVDLSDVMASITPSQPSPASQAPAARTSPPVSVAVQADGEPGVLPSSPSAEPIPEAPKPLPDEEHRPAEAKTSDQGALSSEPGGVQDRRESTPPTPSQAPKRGRPETVRSKLAACHAEHPSWPPKLIAEHLGVTEDSIRACASRNGLNLPTWADYQASLPESERTEVVRATPAQPTNRDRVREGHAAHPDFTAKELAHHLGMDELNLRAVASQVGIKLPKASTIADRVKASPAKPQEPVERAGPPTPRPEPKQPPASTPAAPEPFDDDEPAPVVRRVMKAPTGRFYLRDKVSGLYVHQSLQQSATMLGPMMTSDRKWAWFDTMERYRGAKKKWPELADMRKEGAQS